MKRVFILKAHVWYHPKTLEKYQGSPSEKFARVGNNGNNFTFYVFNHLTFVEHPKTKRLAYAEERILREVGFYR